MTIIHWKRPANGDFAVASNWNPATVPGASDLAAIDAIGATYTVTASADKEVKSLTTAATATLLITNGSTFTIDNGTGVGANAGTIAIGDGTELVFGGTLKNIGKLTLNSTASGVILFSTGALTGGGKVVLSDNAGNLVL